MNFEESGISGVWIIESSINQDDRGEFSRLFCVQELHAIIGQRTIVQINRSMTRNAGAVRGLHYQNPPVAEMKIVRCLKGAVYDVAVDLREGSQSFLKWTGVELTPENGKALVVPEGCAHGFQALKKDSELLYLHTALYTPDVEAAVRFDDPRVGVDWPLEAIDLSARDLSHPHLKDDFKGIVL